MSVGRLGCLLVMVLAGCGQVPTGSVRAASQGAERVSAVSADAVGVDERLVDGGVDEPEPEVDAWLYGRPPQGDLSNFGQMEATLFRGARPTEAGLRQLKERGVQTIINIENAKAPVEKERAWAQANGVRFVSFPMNPVTPPRVETVRKILTVMSDPALRPLYVHCKYGRDRTGLVAYSYRISHDGWTPAQAEEELNRYGFRKYLLGLKGFMIWYGRNGAKNLAAPALSAKS